MGSRVAYCQNKYQCSLKQSSGRKIPVTWLRCFFAMVGPPLWKISPLVGMTKFPIYWEKQKKHGNQTTNHQPALWWRCIHRIQAGTYGCYGCDGGPNAMKPSFGEDDICCNQSEFVNLEAIGIRSNKPTQRDETDEFFVDLSWPVKTYTTGFSTLQVETKPEQRLTLGTNCCKCL